MENPGLAGVFCLSEYVYLASVIVELAPTIHAENDPIEGLRAVPSVSECGLASKPDQSARCAKVATTSS